MIPSFYSLYFMLAVAQVGVAAPPSSPSAAQPSGGSAASTNSTIPGIGSAGQPTLTTGDPITLTLDQVVSIAVNNNTNVVLAKQRYAEAVEGIKQIQSLGLPQISSVLADTYSTFAEGSANYSGVVTNPTLPGGSVVPTVVDQAASFPSSFGLGTISGTSASSGAGTISSLTGTSLTLPANGATTLPSPTSGSSNTTALPGINSGSSAPGTTISGPGTGTTVTTPGTSTVSPGSGGSTTTTITPGSTTTSPSSKSAPGSASGGTTGGEGATSSGADFELAPMPSILQNFVTESGAPSVIASSTVDNSDVESPKESPSAESAPVHSPDQGSGGGSTTTTSGPESVIGKTSVNNYGGRISLSQYVDAFGLLSAEKTAEKLTADFYLIDIDRTENEVAFSAKNLYFNVILAQENVATEQQAVNDAQESVRVTNALVKQGQAAGFDLLSAQTTLANDEQLLAAAQDNYSFAVSDLDYLLGVAPDRQLVLTLPPLPPLNQTISLPQSTQVALQRRPEILQSNQNIALAKKLVKVASSGTTPTIGLVGEYGYNSISTVSGPQNEGLVSAQIAIPIDDEGATRSRVREAKDVLSSQVTTRNEEQLNVQLEVRQAYLNILEGQSSTISAQAGVTLAEETLRVANVQYQNGVGTILDVENAQAQLATARTNLSNAQFTYETALASLVRDIGSR